MSYTTIRDALVAKIEGVAGVGRVQDRERFAVNDTDFLNLYAESFDGQQQVRGWWITRERVESQPFMMGHYKRTHVFVIRGIQGFADGGDLDGSETPFQERVNSVIAALDSTIYAGDTNVTRFDVGPTAARIIELRQFGSRMCHYCELETRVPVVEPVAFS